MRGSIFLELIMEIDIFIRRYKFEKEDVIKVGMLENVNILRGGFLIIVLGWRGSCN